jgi:hypothetical protein
MSACETFAGVRGCAAEQSGRLVEHLPRQIGRFGG